MVENAINAEMTQLMDSLKSADNNVRTQAEAQLATLRQSRPRDLYQGFMNVIQAGTLENIQTTSLACLLLKKFFLDERKSEENLEQLTADDICQMKAAFHSLLKMEEPISLLRRKAEIICKLHKKANSYPELI